MKLASILYFLTITAILAGCQTAQTSLVKSDQGYTLPGNDPPSPDITQIFQCIKETGALRGKRFAIGPFNNDTGKHNAVSDGGTGSFLPTGPNLAVYAVEAISRAGGVAYDYSNLDIVRNIATVGGKTAAKYLNARQNANMPQLAVTVFATALDFEGANRGDLRIGGVGPIYTQTSARAYYAAHIVEPGSQRSLARGYALYKANFLEGGVGVSKFYGGGTGTLVTGGISFASQQPLQRPTAEGIMLSVAFALLEIPSLEKCRYTVDAFDPANRIGEQIQASNLQNTKLKPVKTAAIAPAKPVVTSARTTTITSNNNVNAKAGIGAKVRKSETANVTKVANSKPAPGNYVVQISSQATRRAAEGFFQTARKRHASLIGSKKADIQIANVQGIGTVYRVRIPIGNKSAAKLWCARFKSDGGDCFALHKASI